MVMGYSLFDAVATDGGNRSKHTFPVIGRAALVGLFAVLQIDLRRPLTEHRNRGRTIS